jgi:alpha-ketoglutarate-dependent taurine dioxygenase
MDLMPLTNSIGTEVIGIDVAKPIIPDDFDRLYRAWLDSTILLFRGQNLSPFEQVEFTRNFGEVGSYTRQKFSQEKQQEILVLSNIVKDGKQIGSPVSGRVWHTDGHFLRVPPAGSMLYALQVPPEGGDTWFANMVAAYEALPEQAKVQIQDQNVVISRVQSRPYNYPDRPAPTEAEIEEWEDIVHPMVRIHPETGRKAIYTGGSVPWRIHGMPESQSAPLVTFVQEFSVRPEFTYCHKWQAGDIILWDNRSVLHRATYYDATRYDRLMHRTTIAGSTVCPAPRLG